MIFQRFRCRTLCRLRLYLRSCRQGRRVRRVTLAEDSPPLSPRCCRSITVEGMALSGGFGAPSSYRFPRAFVFACVDKGSMLLRRARDICHTATLLSPLHESGGTTLTDDKFFCGCGFGQEVRTYGSGFCGFPHNPRGSTNRRGYADFSNKPAKQKNSATPFRSE